MPDARSPIRHHLVLYRRDPEQGRARFFSLMIERDLFGTIWLVRNWGFVGSKGQDKVEIFSDEAKAAQALEGWGNPSGGRATQTYDGNFETLRMHWLEWVEIDSRASEPVFTGCACFLPSVQGHPELSLGHETSRLCHHSSSTINHRANRLLAALEPDDFAALEPHLHGISPAAGSGAVRDRRSSAPCHLSS